MAVVAVDPRSWIRQIVTLEQMLSDRACTDVRVVGAGYDLFLLCTAQSAAGDFLAVYITEESKVGVKALRRLNDDCVRMKCSQAILLCPGGLTPFAAKELRGKEEGVRCEIFLKRELAFNITHHHLVPSHRPLSEVEKEEVTGRLKTPLEQLPKIKEADPVAKYLGLSVGAMVEVSRCLGSLEVETYYRVVAP
jgi:DNA-directed RNA polymerase I, II, and III subunit RPABC1